MFNKAKFYLFIIIILANYNIYADATYSLVQDETESYMIYEFHIGHINILQYITSKIKNFDSTELFKLTQYPQSEFKNLGRLLENLYKYSGISIAGPTQYDTGDFYDLRNSSNIKLINQTYTNNNWRGAVYYYPSLKYIPLSESNSEIINYWVSYKLKSLPHLHTRKSPVANQEFHLGTNSSPSHSLNKNIRVFAFPADTKLVEIFHYLPTKQETFKGWILLIYDLTEIKENVGYHVRFILPEKDIPELNIDEVIQILK